MAHYIDGFVLPVPKKNLAADARSTKLGRKFWREHAALEYRECIGDDLAVKFGAPSPKQIKPKPGATVVFATIVFKSRALRDNVNAAVMTDPRISEICDPKNMPFDCARMVDGGFKNIVEA